MLFDEAIPERSADYFKELDELTVKVDPEERRVSDFNWLIGTHHMDEGMLFKINRVVVRRGLIVGYRSLIVNGSTMVEDKTPIHIADLQQLTEEFAKRLHYKAGPGDAQARRQDSTIPSDSLPGASEPDSRERPSCDVPAKDLGEPRLLGEPGKRVRKKRQLTNG